MTDERALQGRRASRIEGAAVTLTCSKCQGEGSLYTSKYGGNDPDVWRTGECPACEGSGTQVCETRGCPSSAIGFNDDGEAMCADCLSEAANYGDEP